MDDTQATETITAKVIVADDETIVRDAMVKALSGEGFDVLACSSGREVLALSEDPAVQVVVTDILMPDITGYEVLDKLTTSGKTTRIILVTGALDSSDARDLIDRGCFGFLAKPVQKSELVRLVHDALHIGTAQGNTKAEYASIPIDHFISGSAALSSIYLRFSDGRFVKLVHSGGRLDLERLYKFKERGISELWISREDIANYSKVTGALASAASKTLTAQENRLKIILHACEAALENLRLMGLEPEQVDTAVGIFKTTVDSFLKESNAISLIDLLSNGSPTVCSHLATCGTLCAAVTQVMEWSSPKTVESLTLAGFLHDIGLFTLPQHLQTIGTQGLTDEDLALYRTHSASGAKLLLDSNNAKDVHKVIHDHHEDGTAQAFPRGLGRTETTPMSKTLMIIDYFCEAWLLEYPQGGADKSAVTTLLGRFAQLPVDPSALEAVKALFESHTLGDARKKYRLALSRRGSR